MNFKLIAIDPGKAKCGIAVMDAGGAALEKINVPLAEVAAAVADNEKKYPDADRIVIGSGTGSGEVMEKLRAAGVVNLKIEIFAERNTTLEAREIYEAENPSRWPLGIFLRRLFTQPKGMDAYAAVAIGRRYLEGIKNRE
jgi:RNase H-fold protein (predicted Holliday junction resolvase)